MGNGRFGPNPGRELTGGHGGHGRLREVTGTEGENGGKWRNGRKKVLVSQWVELLISFKLLSALHTPVPVIPKIKEYQSPSILPQLSRHATLGHEVKAFASAVLQLESITGEKLIPGIRTKKTRLHRSYSVNSPNTGVTFRAAFPHAMEVRKILNEYFLKQPCKRRMNPTLNFGLDLSLPPINVSVHPVDAILTPKARATNWQRWYQMVYYQSRKASRSRSETA